MLRISKRILATILATAMVFTMADYSGIHLLVENVSASTDQNKYSDSKVVNEEIIPDTELRNALKDIISNGNDLTFKELKEYEGDLDLSNYPQIQEVTGLGYMRLVKNMDLSTLSKVKKIDKYEFQMCNLTSIKLPENLEEIDEAAFYRCESLETVVLPDGLKKIHNDAFSRCTKLNNVTLPESLIKIGNGAFSVCESLESIKIPDYINAALENSSDDSVNGLGTGVFDGCTALSNVTFGAAMTAIPAGFFRGTKALRKIAIPEQIIDIRNNAFGESGLYSIDLSKNTKMTTISGNVFNGCSSLYKVILPKSIERIEERAFWGTSVYDSDIFKGLDKLTYIGDYAFLGCKFIEINMPDNIETIGFEAFKKCSLLQKVNFGEYTHEIKENTILSIGSEAFIECYNLTDVHFPSENQDNINFGIEILSKAFKNATNLHNVNFTSSITLIGESAFENCGAIKKEEVCEGRRSVYISKKDIHKTYQEGDTEYRYYTYGNGQEYYELNIGYFNQENFRDSYNKYDSDIEVVLCVPGANKQKVYTHSYTGLEDIDLSNNNRTVFGKNVFKGCINLKTVKLPTEMTEVPEGMFDNCFSNLYGSDDRTVSSLKRENDTWYVGLNKVEFPSKLKKIGVKAFYQCKNLELNNKLPESLEIIEKDAFSGCENIGKLNLPYNLVKIGNNAFNNCSRIIDGVVSKKRGLTECDASALSKIEYIGGGAFANCPFTNFIMNKEGKIKNIMSGTFSNCQFLKDVRFCDSVENVQNNSMSNDVSLKYIDIPDICTINQNFAYGVLTIPVKYRDSFSELSDSCIVKMTEDNISYVPQFSLSVRVVNKDQVVRVNSEVVLPFYTIQKETWNKIKLVKIGDTKLEYDQDNDSFSGIMDELPMSVTADLNFSHNISATNWTGSGKVNIIAPRIQGKYEADDVPVTVEGDISFILGKGDSGYYVNPCAVSGLYLVDVQANPCKEIIADDSLYINSTNNKKSYRIKPNFIPESNDSDMTDKIEWKVETGEEFISYTVSGDGKYIDVKTSGTGCGTSKIVVKAGTIIKTIYVYNVIPGTISSVKDENNKEIANKGNVDIILLDKTKITATLSYQLDVPSGYEDKISYTSDDESVVKVCNVEEKDGVTECELEAVGMGKAVITVKSKAGEAVRTFNVVVSSDNLKLVVKDQNDNIVESGNRLDLLNTNGIKYKYEFNENIANKMLTSVVEDDSIVEVRNIDTNRMTFTLVGKKTGKTKVTIYPAIGNEKCGVTYEVVVDGDISKITLENKSIELDSTYCILTSVTNVFNQSIKDDIMSNMSSITTNTLKFTSSNENVATVDNWGNVTIISLPDDNSKVTISCCAMRGGEIVNNTTRTVTVTPTKKKVSNIVYSGNTNITVNEKTKIDLSFEPVNSMYKGVEVSYVNDGKNFVSYDYKDKEKAIYVTGKKAGKAAIKVRVKLENNVYIEKIIEFNVSDKITDTTKNSISDISDTKNLNKIIKLKVKRGKKKATLTWSKISGITGYQIQMSKNGKKYKTIKFIKKSSTSKFIKKKLKSKKKVYFKIRTYIQSGKQKKYGKWSKVKAVRIK